jgi:hypothetical protein
MTALMPIRKGPYKQEKYEERTLVAILKAGKKPYKPERLQERPL